MKENPNMNTYSGEERIDELLNGYIDDELGPRQHTEVERLIACCRALGQIADPAAIEPLAKMLSPGSIFSFRKRRSSAIRAAAAFALAQISHPRVAELLAPYADDHDPRIRQIAKSRIAE